MTGKDKGEKLMQGYQVLLSNDRRVWMAIDAVPNPLADDQEGFALRVMKEGNTLLEQNMSAETIEAIHRLYKAIKKERKRRSRYWQLAQSLTDFVSSYRVKE